MKVKFSFFILSAFLLAQTGVLGDWRWTDKVAVVTGASSGMGAEIALQLANKGMKVAALARRAHRLEEIVKKTTGKIYPVTCDLTDETDIIRAFGWIEKNLGGVDVLINNAGVYIPAGLTNGESKDWKVTFDVNVLGLSICSREALKTMRTRGDNGQIINISSIVGLKMYYFKNAVNGVYTATKLICLLTSAGI